MSGDALFILFFLVEEVVFRSVIRKEKEIKSIIIYRKREIKLIILYRKWKK